MDREHTQLLFAIKHYWTLCKRLYPQVTPTTKYLDESGDSTKNTLYRMHLSSCCFRIVSLVERDHPKPSKSVYDKLEKAKSNCVEAHELAILIRDTVSHNEDPDHRKYKSRKKYLDGLTIGEIHLVIDGLVTRTISGTLSINKS